MKLHHWFIGTALGLLIGVLVFAAAKRYKEAPPFPPQPTQPASPQPMQLPSTPGPTELPLHAAEYTPPVTKPPRPVQSEEPSRASRHPRPSPRPLEPMTLPRTPKPTPPPKELEPPRPWRPIELPRCKSSHPDQDLTQAARLPSSARRDLLEGVVGCSGKFAMQSGHLFDHLADDPSFLADAPTAIRFYGYAARQGRGGDARKQLEEMRDKVEGNAGLVRQVEAELDALIH